MMLYPEFLLSFWGHETLLLFSHGLLLHALAHISLFSLQIRLFAEKTRPGLSKFQDFGTGGRTPWSWIYATV